MVKVSASERTSIAKRVGIAILTVLTCASVAVYANESDVAIVGAVAGAAAATLASVLYGAPPVEELSRASIVPAVTAALAGFAFDPAFATMKELPPNAIGAGSIAMVVAGASELIKGSGLGASFNALMSTGIVTVLSAFLAVGIGQFNANPAFIGGATGLFAIIIAAAPVSAIVAMALGRLLRTGLGSIIPLAVGWLGLQK